MDYIDYLSYIGDNWWSIIQTILTGIAIYIAIKIANNQRDDIKLQIKYNERQMRVDNAKYAIDSARSDRDVMMQQHFFIYKEQFNDKNTIENIPNILESSDVMLGLAKKDIQEAYDKYNKLLDENPMLYNTTDIETLSTDTHTIQELRERLNKS